MKKEIRFKIIRALGVVIMLIAFPIVPKEYPWYYQVIVFNIGLVFVLASKWTKLKQEIGIN